MQWQQEVLLERWQHFLTVFLTLRIEAMCFFMLCSGTHYANAWINSRSQGKWSSINRLASDCMSDLMLQQAFNLHRIIDGFSHSRQKGLPSLAQRDVTGADYVHEPRAKSLFHHGARWAYTHESTWSRVHEYGWSSFTFLPGKYVQSRPASCDWCRICA